MNHIYRSIWSEKTGTFVAVSENTNNGGKSATGGGGVVVGAGFVLKALAASLLMAFGGQALAGPVGGVVVAGSATIGSGAGTTTITQGSQNVALNWQSFNIAKGEAVNFVQPNSQAVALNRVLGADPSSILGSLSANGKVFLVNPNGILFGRGASVNVGGLVASTLNLSDSDFLAGRYKFSGTSSAAVRNEGSINADGGYVALLGAAVSNQGTINARLGTVALAAGTAITLDVAGDGLINVSVERGALDALVENGGLVQADGGQVLLTAQAAGDLLHTAVNNSGVIQAHTIEEHQGGIRLLGESVINSGKLDASGAAGTQSAGGRIGIEAGYAAINTGSVDASGAQGGQISVAAHNLIEAGQYDASGTAAGGGITLAAGNHIEQTVASTLKADGGSGLGGAIRIAAGHDAWLSGNASASGMRGGAIAITAPDLIVSGARLDASGQAGGGVIRIGGGWQGGDADLANADRTRLVDTALDVSAKANGKGGTAVVWSEQETLFGGAIKATGGAVGGDGGKVEVSSHGRLGFGGSVDASAAHGTQGSLLLDPKDIEIISALSGTAVLSLIDPTPTALEIYGSGTGNPLELTVNGVGINRIVITSTTDSAGAAGAGAVRLYNSQNGALLSTLTGSTANDAVGNKGVALLANGNYVVRSSTWDNGSVVNAGAVTWGNGLTGVSGVVSAANSLVGSRTNDGVGSGTFAALTNGNYVVASEAWNNGAVASAGAVTWGNGSTGTVGAVSSTNSLVGSTALDKLGGSSGGITALTNGNYVVGSSLWDNGAIANAGAATWGDGSAGVSGVVSAANSLVGSSDTENIGATGSIVALTNGNYVVKSSKWSNNGALGAGAATWGNGATGVSGEISAANSLVGTTAGDKVGLSVILLSNGNYLVVSYNWSNGTLGNAGAVTWGSANTGVKEDVSATNSLVGSTSGDQVGSGGILSLTNGNYVVASHSWSNAGIRYVGASTWGNGSTGISGTISAANSLVGTKGSDQLGNSGNVALANGNYVIASGQWDNGNVVDAGAVTWGNGSTGSIGIVSAANSLVGSTANDFVGNVTALSNGNYVVRTGNWDNGSVVNAGAVTWGNGATGTAGAVSVANSLVGSTASDTVGNGGITELSNGNYVVRSNAWDAGNVVNAGAVTWGNGLTGISGAVTASNSLVGSTTSDGVGNGNVAVLTNGNYVVNSINWNNGSVQKTGAVTWGNGATGTVGVVSASNSLVGSTTNDMVGSGNGIFALSNGNYVVRTINWSNNGVGNAGAVTWGNGTGGTVGAVSAANSLVGTAGSDLVGSSGVIALTNGDYAVLSSGWHGVGAATWVSGAGGSAGAVSSLNSLVGLTSGDGVGAASSVLSDGRLLVKSTNWDAPGLPNAGRIDIISAPSTAAISETFATTPAAGSTLQVRDLTALLNTGTAVTLQANNDITVSNAIIANNVAGDGGHLTLQAGRSIVLNASISTDNGNLTLIGNDSVANGVVDANRSAGAAAITMAAGTSINAGTGSVALTLRDGAGLTNSTSGNIGLRDISAATISAVNGGASAGSGIVLDGTLSASATSGAGIVLAGKTFTNNTGATALTSGAGSGWLIWSGDPAADTRGGLAADFKQYNASYGSTTVLGAGKGFLYSLAPTITPGLTGTVSKTYDGIDAASLAADNYSINGAIDGDTVTLNNPASGAFDNKNAGSGKIVTASGLSMDSATNGAVTVYGYQLASTVASANIGTINQADLALSGTRVYDGGTAVTGAVLSATGVAGESFAIVGTGDSSNLATKNVQTASPLASVTGLTLGAGQNGAQSGNYTALSTSGSAVSVSKADLTLGTGNVSKTYDGGTTAAGTAAVTGGTLFAGDTLVGGSFAFTDKNAGAGNKTVSTSAVTVSDGNSGGNYNVSYADNTTSTINQAALTLSGTRVYDGGTAVAGAVLSATGVAGESFAMVGTGDSSNLATKNVQTASPLASVTGLTLGAGNNGAQSGNYTALSTSGSAVSVSKADLALGTGNVSKTYDGGTTAAGTAAVTGGTLFAGDTLIGGSFAFTDKNAGAGNKTVSTSAVTVSDGNSGGNYNVTYTDNTTSTINQAALTLSGTRVYDGGTAVAGAVLSATGVAGESFAMVGTGDSSNLATKNVQTASPLASVTGLTLGASNNGAQSGNYTALSTSGSAVSVSKADLALGTGNVSKIYDGGTTAAGTAAVTGGTLFAGDTLIGGSFAFTDKNAGAGNKTVSTSAVTVSDGNSGGNYNVSYADNTTSTINQAALTLSGTRVYDGGTAVAGAVLSATGVAGESFAIVGTGDSSNLATKNVQTASPLASVTGLTLGASNNGAQSGNYTALSTSGSAVSVSKADLALGTGNVSKTYDGGTTAAGTAAVASGTLFAGDTLSGGSFAFTDKNAGAGNKTVSTSAVTVSDGNGGGNYNVSYADNTTSTINQAALTLSGTRVYDGGTAVAGAVLSATGVAGESFAMVGTGDSSNLATKNVQTASPLASVTGLTLGAGNNGALLGNYTALSTSGSAVSVSKADLTLGTGNVSKTYDGGTTAAGTAAVAGGTLFAGDTLSGGSFGFTDKNAGAGNKTVSTSAVTVSDGNSGGNYTVTYAANTTSTITKAVLTASASASNRTYDGSTTAAAILGITGGLVGTETVTATGGATFNSKDVLTANLVTINSTVLADGSNGGLASNYSLASGQTAAATIAAKALAATAGASNKTYDGSTTAAAILGITGGLVGTETVTATGGATFNSKDVLTANLVTINSTVLADGSNGGLASNYSLASGQTAAATIAAKALAATAGASNKTYDGTTTAAAILGITGGLVGTETVSATGAATFNSKDVLSATQVTVNSTILANGSNGGLASNYSLASGQTAAATIAAKALTATAGASTKTYDGTTTAAAILGITGGLVGTETVTATGDATFNSKDVLNANRVTVNGTVLSNGSNGGLASNYSLASGQTAAATIAAKALTATAGASNKTYDGTTTAAAILGITGGLVGTETVSATGAATFNSKDVLGATQVTVNSTALADGSNGGLASNYSLASGQTAAATIAAKALTATAIASNKTYDGNAIAIAGLTVASGLVGTETVTATGAATFNSKDVLNANRVTVNGTVLSNGSNGGLASNYSLASGQTAAATIAAKALTATAGASNKTYDGTTTAAAILGITGGLVGTETITATGDATFNSKDVLNANRVTVNGTVLSNGSNGGLASNYSLASGQTAAATIAAKALTATAGASNKTYDGTTTAAAILGITGGLVGTETVSATGAATFNSKDVLGATQVTVNSTALADGSNGGLASNYSLASGQTAAATIAAKALTATAGASNKTYDGTTTAAAILGITGGLVANETVTATGGATFNSKDVLSAKLVTVNSTALADGSNGGLASNYSLASGQTAAATIAAKALTATAGASNKTYDGTTTAAAILGITGGLVGTETVSAAGAATFNSKDVLSATQVTVNSTALADGSNGGLASNYSLASGQTAAATIAAKALTATAGASNKTYDGTTTAAAILGITGGLVANETVTATGGATFNSKDVLNANLVTVNGTALADGSNGGLASNYSLASGQTAAATISAKALTATAGASNKTYDGTTTAAAILGITGGLVGTETVSATGAATFNSKDVLDATQVTVNSTALADGSNGGLASNYSLASGQTAAATIAAKALTATAGASNKSYDGTTTAAAILGITGGLVANETVTATGGATFNSKDVLSAKLVTVNSTALADGSNGGLASNYSLASGQTAAATIAAKALTATAGASNKTYDGTTTAAAILGITGGLVANETVTATGGATFNSKDVLSAKLVTVNSTALADGSNGGLASNYSLASGQTAAATIAAKALTATAGASNKSYDGTTTAAAILGITGGLVANETVTATGGSTFNSKDVLSAKLVTVNSTALADGSNGGLASNYSLASGQTAAATIAAKALTATAGASNKTYDGTTTAAAILGITGDLAGTETVSATGSATFNSKDVLNANRVTVNSTALADGSNGGLASNYSLASGQTAAATIAPKALTI
ncbi:YDG domain-containing protein, partial [Massilia sp. DWR3-1-1]|uniref:YDG domain-containing protein n=1 Tax=Massilia sp. DWR3-1-1 TaxID=2804559 RepID=UPI003CECC8F1